MAAISMNKSPRSCRRANSVPSFMQEPSFRESVVPQNECQLRRSRKKQGLCPTCGLVSTHRKKILSMEPLTREGEVLEGWCLKCYTMDFVLDQPKTLQRIEKRRKKCQKKKMGKRDVKSMGNIIGKSPSNDSTCSTRSATSWEADRSNSSLPVIEPMATQFHRSTRDLTGVPGEPSEVESILKQMKNNPHSSEIQSRCCLDLVDLYEEGKEDLFEVIDAITNAMENHLTSAEVQRRGCRAFLRLSMKRQRSASEEPEINHDNCAKMEVEGAIHSVINAMSNHHNSEHVQKEGMRFIRNCLRATGSSKGMVLSRNVVEVIVRAMWNLETSSTVQEDGCMILWCLAVNDPEAQYSIVFNNGIGVILNGMSKHLSIEKVQYHACGALQTLSSSNSEIKENMLENGAYDAIFNSMNEHKYSKSVAETACTAVNNLLNLALDNSSYANACKMNDRHVQVIVRVMRANTGEARIQKKMCQLLEAAAQSYLNIEALRRNETLRCNLEQTAANYSVECSDSVVNIMSLIDI